MGEGVAAAFWGDQPIDKAALNEAATAPTPALKPHASLEIKDIQQKVKEEEIGNQMKIVYTS